MKIFMRETKEKNDSKNNVRLVVTGSTSEERKKKLQENLEKKGIKAVVTDEPVLGVFDL